MFLLLFLVSIQGLFAQNSDWKSTTEKVALFTDRTMYIAGEKLLFSACLIIPDTYPDSLSSRVLYCELITPDGSRITGGKFYLDRSVGNGCLQIPSETVSGTYYLRAYTKWMRNEGPASYHYSRILIINPDKKEVLPARDQDSAMLMSENSAQEMQADTVILSANKRSYNRREKVTVMLPDTGEMLKSVGFACLTVAPESSLESYPLPIPSSKSSPDSTIFYSENRGISLTGHVEDKDQRILLPGIEVNLSILGEKDFMAMRSDSSGRFFFSLPDYSGNRDLFLCSGKEAGSQPVIKIDNDFCPQQVSLPSPLFDLTEPEKKVALELAVNFQVSSYFNEDTILAAKEDQHNAVPFYGKPTGILLIDQYIEMPTIEDYFNELPCEVKVRKSHDMKYFRFYSSQAEMAIFDPLILIDFVAVDDIDRILALSPRDISRIELVNAPYVKGQMMYGGIISFISKENDFAGVDLPSSGTFLSYGFYSTCDSLTAPGIVPENRPDGRNTVYWDPNILSSGTVKKNISFYAPDTPGQYLILLQGIDHSGKVIRSAARIEIL